MMGQGRCNYCNTIVRQQAKFCANCGRPLSAVHTQHSDEEVSQQKSLLQIHRRTLAIHLRQQAILSTALCPPGVLHGILEARENIQRIKTVLRAWNINVEDYPDDEVSLITDQQLFTNPKPNTTSFSSMDQHNRFGWRLPQEIKNIYSDAMTKISNLDFSNIPESEVIKQ